MKVSKNHQKVGSLSVKSTGVRLSKDKLSEILSQLAVLKGDLRLKHKTHTVQITFTGEKEETTFTIN